MLTALEFLGKIIATMPRILVLEASDDLLVL
jgi:hypothetical protein